MADRWTRHPRSSAYAQACSGATQGERSYTDAREEEFLLSLFIMLAT
jgi:hypothetical protein